MNKTELTKADFLNNPTATIRRIGSELYSITANPRYITLIVFLEVNYPQLKPFSEHIWNFMYIRNKPTIIVKYKPLTDTIFAFNC